MQKRTASGRTNTSLPVNLGNKLWASRVNENVKRNKAREAKSLVSNTNFVAISIFLSRCCFILEQMRIIQKYRVVSKRNYKLPSRGFINRESLNFFAFSCK